MPRLISLNVGLPRDIPWHGETVHTAVWKEPVRDRRMVRRLNVDGDGQGDLAGHGGEHRAVMVYQIESYRYWESQLGRGNSELGQFGENFTVEGLADNEVCIGDRYRIGGALFEVTQPRVTCYRVGIRMDEPRMAALLVSHHRPGFYLRVIEEGEVGAGDEIVKVADGPEHVTVAEVDALLYLPGRTRDSLKRALRVPALSEGWKGSFRDLLQQEAASPAWPGFRQLRVARVDRNSASVMSLIFEGDLPAALPGQFLILKVRPDPDAPPVLRNYSLSSAPDAGVYRVSIKQEINGKASTFLHDHVKAGDVVEVSAPRGTFTLQPGDNPVVLLSAGIGVTPVLAILHALVSTPREVWWLYGARNGREHPFAEESRELLKKIARSRSHVAYSKPDPEDRGYDMAGHLSVPILDKLGVPQNADFYLCGPSAFLNDFTAALKAWGVVGARIHSEVFGSAGSITPGIAALSQRQPHVPEGAPGAGPPVAFIRSALTVPWDERFQNLLEFAEACDVPVRWACRSGVCHTCESSLIGGAIDYRPDPLEPPAEGNVLICCSRPTTSIEIDL